MMPMPSLHTDHRARRAVDRKPCPDWSAGLPAEWREQVVVALDFVHFREYEMAATRCFGYDEDGQGCYYAHDYALEALRSDDDESFYQVVAHGESQRAWRLRDGRWLSLTQQHNEECAPRRPCFTLGERPPHIPPRSPA